MAKVKITGHASGTGVVTVTAPNTSTDRTITLPDATDTLIGSATTDALTTRVNATGGRKNMIINGAMNVAQRATSQTGFTNTYGGYKTVDRFVIVEAGAPSGVFTITQDTDAPDGFASSTKWDCTTSASMAAADVFYIDQRIESQDLQHLSYGTSGALQTTISFWVKSNKTGTYVNWFYQANGARHVQSQYTINTADTWEKKTYVVPADTSGSMLNNNDVGLYVRFVLGSGTTYTSGTAPTAWAANVSANRYAGQTVNIADSTANYFNITGVQLELGSVATDFEHRSYGEELALCQRYYQRITQSAGDYFIMASKGQSSDTTRFAQTLARPLRASPTISQGGGFNQWRCFRGTSGVLSSTSTPSTVGFVENAGFVSLQVAGFSGLTDNYFYGTSPSFTSSGYFDMDSEL